MKALFRIFAGVVLVLIGIVGLILPIMPGWIFIIPGLLILADYFPPIRRLVDWAKARFEGARGAWRKTEEEHQRSRTCDMSREEVSSDLRK